MAIISKLLSDKKIIALKLGEKTKLHSDGNNLTLVVSKTAKFWWFKYRFGGKRHTLSLGEFPAINCEKARSLAQAARELLTNGIDPNVAKIQKKFEQVEQTENSFQKIAEEWLALKKKTVTANYHRIVNNRLRDYMFNFPIGKLPINQITPQILYAHLSEFEGKGVFETINRTNKYCSEIFRYGMRRNKGKVCDSDPADLIHVDLLKPVKRSYANVAEKREGLKELLQDIEAYKGRDLSRIALLIMAHTFVRTYPIITMEWAEIDFKKKEWFIPAKKMKGKEQAKLPLLVPLSTQAITFLEEAKKISGDLQYVFPNRNDLTKHASTNLILKSLKLMGWKGEMTGHGFRHVASTYLNEFASDWKLDSDWIETQMAHVSSGSRAQYNFAKYLSDRRIMMQKWSDYLESLMKNTAGQNPHKLIQSRRSTGGDGPTVLCI